MDPVESEHSKPALISPEDARRFYLDGARRWRKPHKKMIDDQRDADSLDFRGVRAAFAVTSTLPHETDHEGKHLPTDPQVAKEHYSLGLTAIRQAGGLPLDDRFVGGYERWANAIVREQAKLIQEAQQASQADPSQ